MFVEHLGYLFDAGLRLAPEKAAVFQDDVVLSFADLDARADRVAHALTTLGVRVGDRVALLFQNDWRFFELLFGALRVGAVVVPLNTKGSDEHLAYCLRDASPGVLFCGPGLAGRGARACAEAGVDLRLIDVAGETYRQVQASEKIAFPRQNLPGTAIGLMLYTSGSTGRPKGVLLSHASQLWNARVMAKATMVDESDRALVAVPLFHKNALVAAMKPLLLVGGSLVVVDKFEAGSCLAAIARHRATYLTGVPAMYQMMLREKEALLRHDLSSVRYALCGSADVPESLAREFAAAFNGAPLAESYGLTEATNPLANSRFGLLKRGSCGRAVPGGEVRLVPAEPGDPDLGELHLRNPGLASGYHGQEALWRERIPDGWFRTGDLMRRDADGYYYFVGRLDDMINVAGEKVYPREVERIIAADEAVAAVVVVAVPHALKGQVPAAFVVPKAGASLDPERIRRRFFEGGPAFAYPRHIFDVTEFPLNGAGKPDRRRMAAMAAELSAGVPSSS